MKSHFTFSLFTTGLIKKFIYSLLCILALTFLVTPALAATATTTVDSNGDVGEETSLVLNSKGFPVISYLDGTKGDLKVAICGNVTCSAGNIITTVDSIGDVGTYTSLALNASGFPVISYYDFTNNDLKVAVCGNTTCSAGNTITTVDSTGDVGLYTSLTLNNNDFPIISYYDFTNNDLKVVICGNVTCSTSNAITTIRNVSMI